jgi:hypothetical protein
LEDLGDLVASLPAKRRSQIIYGAAILLKCPQRFIAGCTDGRA